MGSGSVGPATPSFFRVVLATRGALLLYSHLRISLSIFIKIKACWEFVWHFFEPTEQLGENCHIGNTEPTDPWIRYSSFIYIFFLSSIFHSCLVNRSCLNFVTFIPKYFVFFDAIADGIVWIISTSSRSLLVYRNRTDSCILTSSPTNSLNSFISSRRVFKIDYIKYYIWMSMSLEDKTSLLLPFQSESFCLFYTGQSLR